MRHAEIQNFKPSPNENQARLECIASTPNYPLVEFRNYVILDVKRTYPFSIPSSFLQSSSFVNLSH